jgi:hypothetical protein
MVLDSATRKVSWREFLSNRGQLLLSPLGRSRPAADAAREVTERWLLEGLDVSVGHRRCSCDPSSQNDAGRTPAS